MTDQSDQSSPPPSSIDRDRMTQDVERLSSLLAAMIEPKIPRVIRTVMSRGGLDLRRVISEVCSSPMDLPDADLAYLIDALATQLGAWRGLRAPVELTPELEAAFDRFRRSVTLSR